MMDNITHKFLILSGKGGVGKSTIAVNLAIWLSMQNRKVGLLDIDIHGPSIPKLLNLEDKGVRAEGEKINPVVYSETLKIMSIGFLLPDDRNAVIWRGPMKHTLIKQFLTDVCWGSLDYLVVDCPPGTGDEPLSVVQLLNNADGAVIVTTPQQIAVIDVKKCITFCKQLDLSVLGVIENMSGLVCPHCHRGIDIFKAGGGKQMAKDFNVPFLGSIPVDTGIVSACDSGEPFIRLHCQSPTAQAIVSAFKPLLQQQDKQTQTKNKEAQNKMRIAIPTTNGRLSAHFGHCEQFAVIDVDTECKTVDNQQLLTPPPHEPGLLPKWLAGLHVELIIASGMGQRAQQLFKRHSIDLAIGAPDNTALELAEKYLTGQLQCGENICDH